jgi:hypothetical protein
MCGCDLQVVLVLLQLELQKVPFPFQHQATLLLAQQLPHPQRACQVRECAWDT